MIYIKQIFNLTWVLKEKISNEKLSNDIIIGISFSF